MKGVLASLTASLLFGVLYYYVTWLQPLDGLEVFAWRVVLTVPYLAVFLFCTGGGSVFRHLLRGVWHRPVRMAAYMLSAGLLGVQLWLFTWAPLHGYALDVSLGYFLMPLVMVVIGRWYYADRLSVLQYVAAGVAALGVMHEVYRSGGFSWPALVVALGYPPYFLLRRRLGSNTTAGFFLDMLLLMPLAAWLLTQAESGWGFPAQGLSPALLIAGLGILTVVSLTCYMLASRLLNLSLFGLLGYVEPALLVVAAIALGERLTGTDYLTYLPIWAAVALLAGDGFLTWRRSLRRRAWVRTDATQEKPAADARKT